MAGSDRVPPFLRPPPQPDSDEGVRARIAWWLVWLIAGCSAAGLLTVPLVSGRPLLGVVLYGALLGASLGSLLMIRRGHDRIARIAWSLACFASVHAGILSYHGVYSPAVPGIPATIVIAGVLWSGRAAAGLATVSVALMGVLTWGQRADPTLLSGQPPPGDVFVTVVVVAIATVAVSMGSFALSQGALLRSQRAEAALASVLEQSIDGMLLLDGDGTVRLANRRAREMLGQALVGKALGEIRGLPEVFRDSGRQGVRDSVVLRFGDPVAMTLSDGRPVDIAIDRVDDPRFGAQVVIRDVSARREIEVQQARLQEQLVQAQKQELVGQLAGGVAHDFNNYLGVILGVTQLALETRAPSDDLRQDLTDIQAAAGRAADVARRLLAFAREERARPRPTDLDEVVRGLQPLLDRLTRGKHVVTVDLAEGLEPVEIEPSHAEVVLVNLVVNARDASPAGSTITIRTDAVEVTASDGVRPALTPGRWLRLAVLDEGTGVPAAVLDQLFEPFFTTKLPGEGTGLGLPIILGIVTGAGGGIRVRNRDGGGAAFEVYLPPYDEAGALAGIDREAARDRPRDSGDASVLVVDDEAPLRRIACRILEADGYRVAEAESGRAALAHVEAHGLPDLLVTDVVMPGMSGRELARRLREQSPELRVLYVSGYPGRSRPADAHEAFLGKPFDRRAFLDAVAGCLAGA